MTEGPEAPAVSAGLATKLGIGAAALSGVFGAVSLILKGDHSQETLGAFATAAVALYSVITGRMNQATAHITAGGTK